MARGDDPPRAWHVIGALAPDSRRRGGYALCLFSHGFGRAFVLSQFPFGNLLVRNIEDAQVDLDDVCIDWGGIRDRLTHGLDEIRLVLDLELGHGTPQIAESAGDDAVLADLRHVGIVRGKHNGVVFESSDTLLEI